MMGENGLRTKPESQRQREKNESDALVWIRGVHRCWSRKTFLNRNPGEANC
jgi:hypothetical protein